MAIITEIQEEEEAAATTNYEVFLSFRGKDTRLGFTDYLYNAFVEDNISTFRDEEEVETGEELKPELARAIKSSRASIIVLSKNYASSSWCLDELLMILEQRKSSGHIVLPIFYNVEPTNVRKQESTFGEALLEHERRMETEKDQLKKLEGVRKLEMWRKGLTEVADLKGIDVTGRRERVVIEEVVKEINTRLGLHMKSKIPHLIGMNRSILIISSWLKGGTPDPVEIVTIWGMAGIGKTTLANYIYKLHRHEFERSSFVEDIERKCTEQTYALLDLQKQLLGDILKKRMIGEHNVDVLTSKIEKALLNKQTFLVLDGIDTFEQLDVLIGTKGFHPGSKIIITTRDVSLTEKCALFRTTIPPKHEKHALHSLSDTKSLRLLCWHAFGDYKPKEGYKKESIRASKYCGGHPLALKVLGRSLKNEDIETWNDTFELLETRELHTEVHKVLQISFDSLPFENCKELFKHIACFFVGKDREVTEKILKGCGIVTSGITKLINRGLLTIGERNELKMHQLVQEMGRDIVCRESPDKPWKRSRVWNHEESLDLLLENKGTTKIRGLVLDMKMIMKEPLRGLSSVIEHGFEDNDPNTIFGIYPSTHIVRKISSSHCKKIVLRTDALRKMDNLHLLQLNHVKLKGSYKNFPKGLRGLCMHGFQLEYIPNDLPMQNLVALDMSYSDLTQLWKGRKLLRSLKILNLSYCKLIRVGGFSGLPAIERLILTGCASLTEVSESIGGCDGLVLLDMRYCKKLKKLPNSISKLTSVRILSSHHCKASICTQIHVSLLVYLSLRNSNLFIESFPMDFSCMASLSRLNLDNNPIDSLPECVGSLSKLEVLSVGGCWMLKSVLCPSHTIKHLATEDCSSLVKITFPQEMSAPPDVFYYGSRSLSEIQGIFKIQPIAEIDEKILCSLGWTDLQHVKDLKVQIMDLRRWFSAKKLPVQMYYEFGIFSTCFPGKVVPDWFAHKGNGSSISFTMPPSSMNKTIQGINICFVHTYSDPEVYGFVRIKVRNVTKERSWIYYGCTFSVGEADGDMVWLSHWMFGNNELENGDEVSVKIFKYGVIKVRECAVSPVYNDRDNEEDPLSYYKSWKHIIGGDLSDFQSSPGCYLLSHDHFLSDWIDREFLRRIYNN